MMIEEDKIFKDFIESMKISEISINVRNDGDIFISLTRNTNKPKVELPEKYDISNEKTTLYWKDGTTTTVKKCEDDEFNPRLAFLTAFFQKYSGLSKNKSNKYLGNLEYREITHLQGKKPKHARDEEPETDDKFEIGDRVHFELYGDGTIMEKGKNNNYLVIFDEEGFLLHDGNGFSKRKYPQSRCWWCLEEGLRKI